MLGWGLGEDPRRGDSGERVAFTPSLILFERRARLDGGSRAPLPLVLFDDSVPELGSARSLGPCACDEASSTRILRTLMGSLPKLKKEKKYCDISVRATTKGKECHTPRQ